MDQGGISNLPAGKEGAGKKELPWRILYDKKTKVFTAIWASFARCQMGES